ASGMPTIAKNFGRGTGSVNMSLRVSRTWDFVRKESAGGANGAAAAPASGSALMKYYLTLSAFAINPLNHPNFAPPNGNLASPFFGKPLNLQNAFSPGNATYNRKITLQVQMTF